MQLACKLEKNENVKFVLHKFLLFKSKQRCNDTLSDLKFKNQQCAKFNEISFNNNNNKIVEEWEHYFFEC